MRKMVSGLLFVTFTAVFPAGSPAWAQETTRAVRLSVDLREAPKYIFHATMGIPVKPGPLTLVYPKWIPGEHSPTGPIVDLAGLQFSAGGKPVAWRRDDVDMYAFHCDVPPGAEELHVSLDYLSPTGVVGGREKPSSTSQLAILNWYTVLLYPQGVKSDDLTFVASLKVPSGWKYATALPVAKETNGGIEFQPASLTTLVDSPVLTGAHMRTIELSPGQKPDHYIHLAGDGEVALQPSIEQVQHWRQLVAETGALFGARHYRRYDFLLTVSDNVEEDGIEHHESSDDRVPARIFADPDLAEYGGELLPHEFTHSWNGKYRRPVGLATPNYQDPMKGELLWVYEGMTQYYGTMLSARIGNWSPEVLREILAWVAAYLNERPGRIWRDLEDTAISARLLYGSPEEYQSWRRTVDYYDEGALIWLEADTIIRQETKGQKSLDDFCRKFEGGENTGPKIVPYTFEDVVKTLQDVAPYDWRAFFTQRLNSHQPGGLLGGIENSGWKLVFNETPNDFVRAANHAQHHTNFIFSLGVVVREPGGEDGGEIAEVIPGSPAAKAGLAPGMQLIAVNGRRWTPEMLIDAIRRAKNSNEPIEVLAENEEYFQTYRIDYHGGERYPHLERIAAKPDLLSEIARRKAPLVAMPID
jgi:predicted metalloprotease with PDZ domain